MLFALESLEQYDVVSNDGVLFRDVSHLVILFEKFVKRVHNEISFRSLQVEIDHGCFNVAMAKKFFDGVNIYTIVE